MIKKEENHLAWITALNIVACIMVVGIHCNAMFDSYERSNKWMLSGILNACYY